MELERMKSILVIRPRGLFISQAQRIYLKQWDEEFPKNLWDAMEESKLITINRELKIVLWTNCGYVIKT